MATTAPTADHEGSIPDREGKDRLAILPATKKAVAALAEHTQATHDEIVAAGVRALADRTLGPRGLARLDLIRALENLEQSVALVAQIAVVLSDQIAEETEATLKGLEQIAREQSGESGGK